jgi:hypothetical protein
MVTIRKETVHTKTGLVVLAVDYNIIITSISDEGPFAKSDLLVRESFRSTTRHSLAYQLRQQLVSCAVSSVA